VEDLDIVPRGTRIPVTASFGVSNVEGLTWRQMIGKADVALYAAKQAGRNCIRLAEQDVLVGSELVATGRPSGQVARATSAVRCMVLEKLGARLMALLTGYKNYY
jgi:hypothetical protein